MVKKSKNTENVEIVEVEPEPVKISKKTGKPVRPLSTLQLEVLAKGREIGVLKKKELNAGVDLERKADIIKKQKENIKLEKNLKQQLKIESQKKMYNDAIKDAVKDDENDDEEEEVIVKKSDKKVKKKVIKYIEESSSDSEEEVVIKRKKDKTKSMMAEVSKQELKKRLENEQSNSLAKMLAPSYY